MSERDYGETFHRPFFRGVVDLIRAAGFRPPPQEIESPEHLDKLPPGTIIVDYYGFAWQKSRYERGNPWRRADGSPNALIWAVDLPDRIIMVPSDAATVHGANDRRVESDIRSDNDER